MYVIYHLRNRDLHNFENRTQTNAYVFIHKKLKYSQYMCKGDRIIPCVWIRLDNPA